MFQKLRNRFLLMNMAVISLIMLVAFIAIYMITYQNVRNEIGMELQRVFDTTGKMGGGGAYGGGGGNANDAGTGGGGGAHRPAKEPFEGERMRSVSFALRTDPQWTLTETISRYDMTDAFYDEVLQEAKKHPKGNHIFTLDGTRWASKVTKTPFGYSVVYADVTAQLVILTQLIYTFSIISVVMLGVIYVASRYFANRSIAPVKEAFEKQKQFIADASHELKTPLAVIQTHADVLLASGAEPIREHAKWLHHIKAETERMKVLTNDLLYLTEMDDARTPVLHAPFDASSTVMEVLLTMEAVVYEKGLSLHYEVEPGLTATGSSQQLKQVAMILLDNAIKYNIPNGTITLTLQIEPHHLQLAVANTGTPIPAEHLDRVFDRFFRSDPSRSRQYGGHGLGLAIAKSLVEQHRGRIFARSDAAAGTNTFHVQLPLT